MKTSELGWIATASPKSTTFGTSRGKCFTSYKNMNNYIVYFNGIFITFPQDNKTVINYLCYVIDLITLNP
jgi:hypothetical protein